MEAEVVIKGVSSSLEGARTPATELDRERQWIREAQAGQVRSFNHLVLKWEKVIYNLALRMLGNPEDAAEVTQEAFLAAYRSIGRFRIQSRFSTWLYRIATNHAISRLRRRPRGVHYPLDEECADPLPSASSSQEAELLERERRAKVRRALGELDPDQRAVIELKMYQEETFSGIAEILQVPLSTVKSRFYAGLERLKYRLGGP